MVSGSGRLVLTGVCAALVTLMAASTTWAQPQPEPRPLAPGVLKVFPPRLDARDTFTVPMPVPGLQAKPFDPHFAPKAFTVFGQTKDVVFFRDIWQIEFATVGVRQIELAFRFPDGEVRTRHYWYMPYRIRDLGRSISYREVADESAVSKIRREIQIDGESDSEFGKPGKFYPDLRLQGWIFDENGERQLVTYRDQYLPEVAREIQKLEDPLRRLFDKLEVPNQEIPRLDGDGEEGLWGVAVWEDVDPNIDFCSVQIRGLTNAYRMAETLDGDIQLKRKVLQLNFYRPGDSVEQTRDRVFYGVPLVLDPTQQIEICKRYFLPGPQIHASWYDTNHGNDILLAEIDAEVSLDDFSSPVVAQLDGGKLPEHLLAALQAVGLTVAADAAIKTIVPTGMWQVPATRNGEAVTIDLKFSPQYWEKKDRGIRFLKTIDYLWVYQ